MPILITGGSGVIGSTVARTLFEAGESPVLFDVREDRSLLGAAGRELVIETGDIRNLSRLEEVVWQHRIDRIAHLGALMPETAAADPYTGFSVNTAGTLNVLEAARRAGVERVVFTSSKSALGVLAEPYIHPHYEPVPDSLVPDPQDVYGSSKYCSEQMGRRFALETGMTFIVLRLASTYGPGKTARHGKVGILSHIVESAFRGESVSIPRGLEQKNDFLYCKDIAQAVIKGLSAPLTGPHLFQIGSGRLAGLTDFIDALRTVIPQSLVTAGPGVDYSGMGVGRYFHFDIEPARRLLGYEPEYDVHRGVADYVAWLKENS